MAAKWLFREIGAERIGNNCARINYWRHTLNRHTTTETRVAYDNSTWRAINTAYTNSIQETSGKDWHCFSQSRLLSFWMCSKVIYMSKRAVNDKQYDKIDATQCDKMKTNIRWPLGDVFSTLSRDLPSDFVFVPLLSHLSQTSAPFISSDQSSHPIFLHHLPVFSSTQQSGSQRLGLWLWCWAQLNQRYQFGKNDNYVSLHEKIKLQRWHNAHIKRWNLHFISGWHQFFSGYLN